MGEKTSSLSTAHGYRHSLAKLFQELGAKRLTVKLGDQSWLNFVMHCGTRLVPRKDDAGIAVQALYAFVGELSLITGVQAAAFVASRLPSCPTTLVVEVLTALASRSDEEARTTIRRVTAAHATLTAALDPILPSGVRFVNTSGKSVEQLESELKDEWASDGTTTLLGFMVFERA